MTVSVLICTFFLHDILQYAGTGILALDAYEE